MKLIKTFLTLFVSACLLASCSTTFTYNQLDWLIPWYVDSYVDLSRDQKQFLKRQLTPVLQWHREEELQRYIEILDRVESDLNEPVSADQVRQWIDDAFIAAQRVEDSMLAVALDFGASLSDAQMQEFADSLWEQQEEYEQEFLERDEQEYIEDNADNLEDFLRRFVGRLTNEQELRLRKAAESMQRFDGAWLAEREAWLSTLEPLLQRPEGWQRTLRAEHSKRNAHRPPAYREIVDHNLVVVTAAVADVLNQMSPKQHERAKDEIDDLRSMLLKLISQSKPPLNS